jgi:hypothetical protein
LDGAPTNRRNVERRKKLAILQTVHWETPSNWNHRHLISIDWVEYVDRKVHLNKPSQKAMLEWQTAA